MNASFEVIFNFILRFILKSVSFYFIFSTVHTIPSKWCWWSSAKSIESRLRRWTVLKLKTTSKFEVTKQPIWQLEANAQIIDSGRANGDIYEAIYFARAQLSKASLKIQVFRIELTLNVTSMFEQMSRMFSFGALHGFFRSHFKSKWI